MRGSGRSGEFDVMHVTSPFTTPKFRTIISIQPDDQPPPRLPYEESVSPPPPPPPPPFNGYEVTADRAPANGVDPDETASVTSSTSSDSRTPWTERRQNGHIRSPSSASSSASPASYRLPTPGSYVSPTSPRRLSVDVDEQRRQLEDHPFFALFRDVPNEESQILSGRGTVRGVRNRVKSGIAVFVEKHHTTRQTVCLNSVLQYLQVGNTTYNSTHSTLRSYVVGQS